jgi:hypothetical protein
VDVRSQDEDGLLSDAGHTAKPTACMCVCIGIFVLASKNSHQHAARLASAGLSMRFLFSLYRSLFQCYRTVVASANRHVMRNDREQAVAFCCSSVRHESSWRVLVTC